MPAVIPFPLVPPAATPAPVHVALWLPCPTCGVECDWHGSRENVGGGTKLRIDCPTCDPTSGLLARTS